MSEKILRCVWSVDNDPADVLRSDAVAGLVEGFHCFFEKFNLSFRRRKLDGERLLYNSMDKTVPYLKVIFLRFLPPLKGVGILGGF